MFSNIKISKKPLLSVSKENHSAITSLEEKKLLSSRFLKFTKHLHLTFTIFLILSCTSAPEGAIRDGDYLPIVLIYLLLGSVSSWYFYRIIFYFVQYTNTETKGSEIKKKSRHVTWEIVADVALAIFLFCVSASFLRVVIFQVGDVRLSSNSYWTFITPVLFYFQIRFFRRFFATKYLLSLTLVFFACALAEAGYSLYSYVVLNPQLREEYLANPDKILKENGLSFASDSAERILFEKRLLNSSEPTGTYGLANTLAGFLTTVFLLGTSMLFLTIWTEHKNVQGTYKQKFLNVLDRRTFGIIFLGLSLLTIIFFTIVLSKSRAGLLGVFGGLCIGGLLFVKLKLSPIRYISVKHVLPVFITMLTTLTFLIISAFYAGIIDQEVFTEAGKSLRYRFDYWQASWKIIRDNPILGIGPGEFQSVYPHYISPSASEFIADPHNFFFEIASLFGIPAACALLVFFLAVFITIIKKGKCINECVLVQNEVPQWSPLPYISGAYLGILLLFIISFFQVTPVDIRFIRLALLIIPLTIFCSLSLLKSPQNPSSLFVISLIGSLLNLCAAGGIGYPVVTIPLFYISAIVVNYEINNGVRDKSPNYTEKKKATLWLGSSIFVLILFYLTAFVPHCKEYLFLLQYNSNSVTTCNYVDYLKKGQFEKIDRSSSQVAIRFYNFSALNYSNSFSKQDRYSWQKVRKHIFKVSPNSSAIRETCGDFDWCIYLNNKIRNREFLDSALFFYSSSVLLSPTECRKRVKLFRVYCEKEMWEQAIKEAKKAIELDKTTAHQDRKLTEKTRHELLDYITHIQR